ncbi:spermine/spermidine synthase like protein [Zymoseptoria brevis]|uniref:Spermine/spermidine synthase like protein n=1 Tax=Zymoseptoria brevis TaxID=1047168 RepID=A0A0F4GWU2_9PEZI|nr:spermine/spermidine synthase like protein [Zymoseptoria brevis]
MAPKKHRTKQSRPDEIVPPSKAMLSLRAAAILFLAAATSPLSQLTLAPVYGSIPASINHTTMITVSILTGIFLRFFYKTKSSHSLGKLVATWMSCMPVVRNANSRYSGELGIVRGPIVNGLITCHSILIPSGYVLAELWENLSARTVLDRPSGYLAGAVVITVCFRVLETFLSTVALPSLRPIIPSLDPISMQLILSVAYSLLYPTHIALLNIAALAAYYNPHLSTSTINTHLQPHNWTLLDRAWSNTGYISVLESSTNQYRILRADHSLLGGEWLLTPERRLQGWQVPESIYAVFSILESVRLIDISPAPPIPDASASALVIGLGIGTAPSALIAHGIHTTIVELDPVVHAFATKYFALPTNHTAILQDAVSWVHHTSSSTRSSRGEKYDYIIHDVFTGGAEPLPLFTTSFLTSLRSLLHPNGVIALNYAGDLSLPLTRLVLHTISKTFSHQCKLYRDAPLESKSHLNGSEEEDFLNMVVFCRNSPGEIRFRKPVKGDFVGSRTREWYMLPKKELEIEFPKGEEGSVLEEGEVGMWEGQQQESAMRHWGIMRKVLPGVVWELW